MLLRLVKLLLCVMLPIYALGIAEAQPRRGPEAPPEATEKKRVVIKFVTESEFPPYNFYDEDGILTGFNVDLARAICLQLDVTCDIKVRRWETIFEAIQRREADAAIAAHMVSAQALLKVDFTDRYMHTPGRFAGRRDLGKIDATAAGLEGMRIGVAAKTVHEAFVRQFFQASRVEVFDDPDKIRDALKAGQVEVIFDDAASLAFWLNGTLSQQCCEFKGDAYLEPKFFGDGIAIAVSRADPELKLELNTALREIRASGLFEELVARYFPFQLY